MSSNNDIRNVIIKHLRKLQEKFPHLELINDSFLIRGNLGFSVTFNDKVVRDDYDVEILIPDNYPQTPPKVREIGNKIPKNKDNHIISDDETLCLGAPLAVKITFAQQRNLLWFVEKQVVPHLFSHSYKRDYGQPPFDNLSHGPKGLLEYYKELFATKDNIVALDFLRILSSERYDDYANCPCGSGLKIKKCHYRILKKARKQQRPEEFYNELRQIVNIFPYL